MDLKDLKKAWDNYSSKDSGKQLDENSIKEMLGGRTRNLIERIDRNIKIGFFVILALILFFIIDDLILSPIIIEGISDSLEVPKWIIILDIITNLVIIISFIAFVFRYYWVKKKCDITCNLTETLNKIIHILNLYQRIFYFAIAVLVLSTSTGFIVGLYRGVIYQARENGIPINEIEPNDILMTIIIGLIVLVILSGGLFLLFRWGFRRLYGNYLKQLKLTLRELDEIN